MPRLTGSTVESLSASVRIPSYDRTQVSPGIVHLGVGGFHRSHQAMYLNRLMSQGQALDWGICGVGVLPGDRRMKEVMDAQDCLYTLVESHPDGYLAARVIGSIVDYLFAPEDPAAVVEQMADLRTRIVSLTVTEGGYNVSAATSPVTAAGQRLGSSSPRAARFGCGRPDLQYAGYRHCTHSVCAPSWRR
jgi:mannitol 2-dehydrogenase